MSLNASSAIAKTSTMKLVKTSAGSLPFFEGKPRQWPYFWKRFRASMIQNDDAWAILTGSKTRKDMLAEHKEEETGDVKRHFPVFENSSVLSNAKYDAANLHMYGVYMEVLSEECEKYTEVREGDGMSITANLLRAFAKRTEMAKLAIAMDVVSLKMGQTEQLDMYHHRSHLLHKKVTDLKITLSMLLKAIYLRGLTDRYAQPRNMIVVNGGSLTLEQAEEKVTVFDDWIKSSPSSMATSRANAAQVPLPNAAQVPLPTSADTKRFKGHCKWCGIWGHPEADCRKKKAGFPKNSGNFKKSKFDKTTLKSTSFVNSATAANGESKINQESTEDPYALDLVNWALAVNDENSESLKQAGEYTGFLDN
jgi:hypothetical protein